MSQKTKLIIPKFASEAEDARWHDRHQRELEAEMLRRIKQGSTLTLRQFKMRAKSAPGKKTF